MNEKFIHSWAGHLDFIAADLSKTTGKDLPHALEQLPTRLKMLADEMRAEAPNGTNEKSVSDLLTQAAELAFSAAPLAVDRDNGPAINYLAEWLRDIASEEADAKKPFHYDLGWKLREWADMADREGLDSEDIGKMSHELASTARAIGDGLCFVAPVVGKAGTISGKSEPAPIGNIGGQFSYEVDRLLGLAFDVEDVRGNAPPRCSERLAGAVAVLREIAAELTPAQNVKGE